MVWNENHWSATAEIVGERVISSADVRKIEQLAAQKVAQPVELNAWSRAELMVTGRRAMALDDYTKDKLQSRTRAEEPRTYSDD